MTKFYFVRHGEPNWEAFEKYRFKGHGRDLVELTSKGKEQAIDIAKKLKDIPIDCMITSPYTRTLQTAAILSQQLDIAFEIETDLREWQPDLSFEYSSYKEFSDLDKDYRECKGIIPKDRKVKWESFENLKRRVDQVLEKYKEYEHVVVVAHEKVIETQTKQRDIKHCDLIEIKK